MFRHLFGRGKPKADQTGAQADASARLPQPLDLTDADFDQVLGAAEQLAVVDFWADWCEPCRTMSAYVGFLAADYAGRLLVAALDVDENPAVAERRQILGLPTLLFLRQGVEVGRVVGLVPYADLKRQVEQYLAAA